MNYLLIYATIVVTGIVTDLYRLVIAKLLNFNVEEFSIFIGPKLVSFKSSKTTYVIKGIPLGSSLKFTEEFFHNSRFSRLILGYLPEALLLALSFVFVKYKINYILYISGIFLLVINGFSTLLSIIFDTKKVFYRFQKDMYT